MDCSPPGSFVHGILQARILEWVAISYSKGSSQSKDQIRISCTSYIGRQRILYHCATWEGKGYLGRKKKAKCIVQFSSAAQSSPTLWDPMDCSTPGLPVHHQLLEFTQTHVHRVGDAIQPSHPLLFPFPPTFNLSQHQGLFQWINSSHQMAKVLEFQLQH